MSQADLPSEQQPEQLIRVVDALIEELARLASEPETEPKQFWGQLGDSVQTIVNPDGLVVVSFGNEGESFLVFERNGLQFPIQKISDELRNTEEFHSGNRSEVDSIPNRPVGFPIRLDSENWGALLVTLPAERRLDANYAILSAVVEIVAEFVKQQELSRRAVQADWFRRFYEFSISSHTSLDAGEAASVVANDTRVMFSAERAQVYHVNNGRISLAAVSAVAAVENRSSLMRLAKTLAKQSARSGQAVLTGQPDLPAHTKQLMDEYQEQSGMGFIAVLPVRSPVAVAGGEAEKRKKGSRNNVNGILLLEYPAMPDQLEFVRAAKTVLPHVGLSISNSRIHSSIPFRRSLLFVQRLLRLESLGKLLIAGVVLVIVGVLLATVQIDHKIRITGELRPETERVVFAPQNAFVESVVVNEGDQVRAGDLLATLVSPELEQQLEKINGELAKLVDHRASKQVLLNQAASGNVGDATLQTKLASEIADLTYQIQTYQSEKRFVESQIAKLQIYAPIDGTVVTWNVQQGLVNRPVKWGDPLMKVADESSDWELQLKAPENKVAYILEALERGEDELQIQYFFKSQPKVRFQTGVADVAPATEIDRELGPSVAITCPVDETQEVKRHGAKVIGYVVCGQKSIGYVWTYELLDTIRRRFVW